MLHVIKLFKDLLEQTESKIGFLGWNKKYGKMGCAILAVDQVVIAPDKDALKFIINTLKDEPLRWQLSKN